MSRQTKIIFRKNNLIDMEGTEWWDKLKVLRKAQSNNTNEACWIVQCSCGTRFIARGSRIRSGSIRSCLSCDPNVRRKKISNPNSFSNYPSTTDEKKLKIRSCLKCDCEFSYNPSKVNYRLCKPCRQNNSTISDDVIFSTGRSLQ